MLSAKPPSPCQQFGPIYGTKITQPPLLWQNLGNPSLPLSADVICERPLTRLPTCYKYFMRHPHRHVATFVHSDRRKLLCLRSVCLEGSAGKGWLAPHWPWKLSLIEESDGDKSESRRLHDTKRCRVKWEVLVLKAPQVPKLLLMEGGDASELMMIYESAHL